MFTDHVVRSQRVWARVAGSMFWVVLVVDMTGMRAHSAVLSRSLLLLGSLCTVPLAFGLYYALKPVQVVLASTALGLRLLEAALGVEATVSRFVGSDTHLAGRGVRSAMWELAQWGDATNFAAFVFTIGSTVFFYLFVRSVYIPKVLAWWGLFASVVAMTACFTHLLRPAFPSMTIYAWIPMLLAETSTGLWLLFKSVRVERQVDGMRDSYAG